MSSPISSDLLARIHQSLKFELGLLPTADDCEVATTLIEYIKRHNLFVPTNPYILQLNVSLTLIFGQKYFHETLLFTLYRLNGFQNTFSICNWGNLELRQKLAFERVPVPSQLCTLKEPLATWLSKQPGVWRKQNCFTFKRICGIVHRRLTRVKKIGRFNRVDIGPDVFSLEETEMRNCFGSINIFAQSQLPNIVLLSVELIAERCYRRRHC